MRALRPGRQAVNQLATIDSANAAKRLEITRQVNQEIANDYKRSFEQVGSSVSSQIMSMIQGQEKFSQAVKNVALSIVSSFVSAGVKMVADWLARQAAMVAASVTAETTKTAAAATGEAARTGIAAAGAAAQDASIFSSMITVIMADAKATAAGVTGFLAPILGPAAPAAGAAAGAGVAALASFDVGSWQIPSNMIAQVHQGEMIVPAAQTPWAQSLMANAAGGAQGGDTHNHYHFSPSVHVNGGGAGSKDMGDILVKTLKAAHARGDFVGWKPRHS